ncbi:unnamed protein product [Brassica napus]|uniref:(rape) hypothetical protein n=1 Tax=Brassica napus TaxID=3708 RepID=A0A816JL70_BRANA|nr:unnamed protein product [Brassica napus]
MAANEKTQRWTNTTDCCSWMFNSPSSLTYRIIGFIIVQYF